MFFFFEVSTTNSLDFLVWLNYIKYHGGMQTHELILFFLTSVLKDKHFESSNPES